MRKKKSSSFEVVETKDDIILVLAKKYAKSKEDYTYMEEAIQAAYQLGKHDGVYEIINHNFILRGLSAHC